MSRTVKRMPLLLMVAALAAGGCGDKADTPKEAAVNYCRAIEERDQGLFLANVQAENGTVATTVLDALAEMSEFFREFTKEYPDAKAEYAGAKVGRIPGYEQVEKAVAVEVNADDANRATAKLPNGVSLRLVRVDETWRVDLSGADASAVTQRYERIKAAARTARGKIGKGDYKDKSKAPLILKGLVEQIIGAPTAPAAPPAT